MKFHVTCEEPQGKIEAMQVLEELARQRHVTRNGVDGYLTVNIGAGNPEYFYQIQFKYRCIDDNGVFNGPAYPRFEGYGETLFQAVTNLVADIKKQGYLE